jgi:cellobiose epimerase
MNYYGLVCNDGSFDARAPKGLVMHARFLWAYSAAYIRYAKREYLDAARAAYDFLRGGQRDERSGGFWWVVDAPGARGGARTDSLGAARPQVEAKIIYGQAFAIYALSEYYLATSERAALDLALETYALLERVARDRNEGGYCEACDRSWTQAIRFALSDADVACDKSMNTNLHVLEALSNLYRASRRKDVRESLASLLEVYARKIFAGKPNLSLYFDRDWKSLSDRVSWGHDIESSWLMTEAAHLAYGGGKAPTFVREAIRAAREGILPVLEANGGCLPRERAKDHTELQRDWWAQAEAVVGNVDAWEETGRSAYLTAANGSLEVLLPQWAGMPRGHGALRADSERGGRGREGCETPKECVEAGVRSPDQKAEQEGRAGERRLLALSRSGPHRGACAPRVALRFQSRAESLFLGEARHECDLQFGRDKA